MKLTILAATAAILSGSSITLWGTLNSLQPPLRPAFTQVAAATDAIDFSYPGMAGKTVTLSDYRGKWVVVNFWATWCPPCLEEIPELIIFHETHYEENAVVIGINYEDIAEARVQTFIDNYDISYPVARVSARELTPFGPVPNLPTSFLISPEGVPVAKNVGTLTSASIEAVIAAHDKKGGDS